MQTRLMTQGALALSTLGTPLLALAQTLEPQYPRWYGHGHMMGDGWGFWWGGPLMLLIFLLACVAIFLLGRRSVEHWHDRHPGPSRQRGQLPGPEAAWGDHTYTALQILNERFARCEIEKQEYDEKKATLLAPGPR